MYLELERDNIQTILRKGVEAVGGGVVIIAFSSLVGACEVYSGVRARFDRGFRQRMMDDLFGEAYFSGEDSSHSLSVLLLPKAAKLDARSVISNALKEHQVRDI